LRAGLRRRWPVLALAGLTALTFVGIAVSNAAFSASTNNTNNTATAAANFTTPPPAPTGPLASRLTVSTFAGSLTTPSSGVFDAAGNLYVSEFTGHRIRRITPAGVVTTFAGTGSPGGADGTGTAASFNGPTGLAFNASGDLFVAEYGGHRIRRITPAGVVTTFAGSGSPSSTDGTGTAASFNQPIGLAFNAAGDLFVADYGGHRIRRITPAGVVTTFAGSGTPGAATGPATGAVNSGPVGIERDTAGVLHITQFNGNRTDKLSPTGSGALSVAWTAPASTGGSAITDYLVEYRISPSGAWTTFGDGVSTTTSTTITGLTNGTAYDLRISAINAAGSGALSSVVTSTPGVAPCAPTNLSLVAGSGQLTATWVAPVELGGAPISDYAVEYRFPPSGPWTVLYDGSSAATSATITGLANGSVYEVRVRAVNSFDLGAASVVVTGTTTGWTPAALGNNLSLWLDASDTASITLNGSNVSTWQDKSGNSRPGSQSNAALQPSYTNVGLNGRPVVTFNGTSTALLTPAFTMGEAAVSVVRRANVSACVAQATTTQNRGLWGNVGGFTTHQRYGINGANLVIVPPNAAVTNPALVSQDTLLLAGSHALNIGVGTPSYTYLNGFIAEMVIATTALSVDDRQRLEGYLAHKWGLTANLPPEHPYKTTPP
jgi:hypothetical protein